VKLGILLLPFLAASCARGLSDANREELRSAAKLSGMAYGHADAGTPFAALSRGAYCSVAAVIRDQKIDPVDAGIACQ
jgi:hypothetical protein